eukprot:TRINITY_DN812_c0_g1_i12.p2 TRINITY_DN812_c0_g1~~TRINITY_DN812_c0_g1_i12.p2  ORF type:complete len:252 (+),score=-14.26 TRINITY_DN812_c0_g1_i12:83-757(+)
MERAYKGIIHIMESAYQGFHPNLAAVYSNLGSIYNQLGQYKEAIENHTKAIHIMQYILWKVLMKESIQTLLRCIPIWDQSIINGKNIKKQWIVIIKVQQFTNEFMEKTVQKSLQRITNWDQYFAIWNNMKRQGNRILNLQKLRKEFMEKISQKLLQHIPIWGRYIQGCVHFKPPLTSSVNQSQSMKTCIQATIQLQKNYTNVQNLFNSQWEVLLNNLMSNHQSQ